MRNRGSTRSLTRVKESVPREYRYLVRGGVFALMRPFFIGDRVDCPCCGGSYRRFVSLGGRSLLCPGCSSAGRHRLLSLYLRDRTSVYRDSLRVVHFAAEYSLLRGLRELDNLDYIPADLDPPRGARRLDMTEIELESGSVDMVICSHVLEHIPDDRKAMAELRRILKPEGSALLMVPQDRRRAETYEDPSITSPADRAAAFGQSDHVRIYGRDFIDRLESVGFRVRSEDYARALGGEAIARYGLSEGDVIYVCS
jgi:SAM-dependent methyltransferase